MSQINVDNGYVARFYWANMPLVPDGVRGIFAQ